MSSFPSFHIKIIWAAATLSARPASAPSPGRPETQTAGEEPPPLAKPHGWHLRGCCSSDLLPAPREQEVNGLFQVCSHEKNLRNKPTLVL